MSEAMRHDIDAIKTQLTSMTETLARQGELHAGHDRRFDSVEKTLHNVVVEQARARGDIEWLKDNMLTRTEHKTDMNLILNRLDGIAGKIEDSRYDSAKNLNRIDDHERRIRALETKPS